MLVADFDGKEWKNAEIVPFQPFQVSPSNAAWHYGQAIFEGIKAYNDQQGNPMIFRPYDNYARFNKSAERMGMPDVPEWLFIGGMAMLIDLDRGWVPSNEGCSLYLRPFMIAMDEFIGVRPSDTYRFAVINSPRALTSTSLSTCWCRINISAPSPAGLVTPRRPVTMAAPCTRPCRRVKTDMTRSYG